MLQGLEFSHRQLFEVDGGEGTLTSEQVVPESSAVYSQATR